MAAQDVTIGSNGFSIARSDEEIRALRRHLDELTQSAAFKGSPRSQQFLRYTVEKALEGNIHGLKERLIGVELFQRPPTYDTAQDAIVRVTASDVRRRLLEHYGRYGDASAFHIQLPRGSYVPEIESLQGSAPHPKPEAEAKAAEIPETRVSPTEEKIPTKGGRTLRLNRRWLAVSLGVAAGIALVLLAISLRRSVFGKTEASLPPWPAILRAGHGMQIVTSDPNVEQLQELIGHSITISDYANRRLIPDSQALTAEQQQFYRFYQHADYAAAVDTPLAVSIARLAPKDSPIQIRSARSLHISDLENGDNMVLIGSPRSNPWGELLQDQLDFRFVFDAGLNQEIVENRRPREHEQARYIPNARGFATGESFALVALVHNRSRSGRALLLAGTSEEGTEAAGHTVTDSEHLARLQQFCRLSSSDAIPDFELLLEVRMLAGSANTTQMVACHLLHNPS